MYATYLIPGQNASGVKAKLDKLARKAARLGVGAIFYTLAKTFSVPLPDEERPAAGEVLTIEALTIRGDAPVLEGWAFVATLQHETTDDGKIVTILRTVDDTINLPKKYRTATPDDCDHCNTRRQRNDTFVVLNVETGEFKQVGRQCLKDFLGHKNPHAIAQYATVLAMLDDFLGCDEGGEGGYGGGEIVLDLRTYLAKTVLAIELHGWTSRTKAKEKELFATADYVWNHMTTKRHDTQRHPLRELTEETYQEVDEALEWLAGKDAAGDYIYNCQTIAELGAVKHRTAGYAASIVSSHRRATDRKLYNEILKAEGTEYVGTIGKRQELLLTLLAVYKTEGYYGVTFIHKFADVDGNAVTWFASNPDVVPEGAAHEATYNGKAQMTKGATYRVKATPKKHDEYNGQPQTVVARVAVQPLAKALKKRRKAS